MPGCAQSNPPLDLSRFSEDTRRRLYDHLRETHFFVPGREPGEEDPLPYTAEDAGLQVFHFSGRWFARWLRLEVPEGEPEAKKVELLVVKPSGQSHGDFILHEV